MPLRSKYAQGGGLHTMRMEMWQMHGHSLEDIFILSSCLLQPLGTSNTRTLTLTGQLPHRASSADTRATASRKTAVTSSVASCGQSPAPAGRARNATHGPPCRRWRCSSARPRGACSCRCPLDVPTSRQPSSASALRARRARAHRTLRRGRRGRRAARRHRGLRPAAATLVLVAGRQMQAASDGKRAHGGRRPPRIGAGSRR